MRILFLTGGFGVGGTERHLSLILPLLQQRGIEVRVCALAPLGPLAAPLHEAGIHIDVILPERNWNIPKVGALYDLLSQARQVARIIQDTSPDICHCFLPHPCIIGWLASKFTGFRPMVMSKRSQMIRPPTFFGDKWLELRALRKADHVLGHSSVVIRELEQHKIEKPRLQLIANGIDPDCFGSCLDSATIRSNENYPPKGFLFVCVANLIPYKGHSDMLHAFAIAAPRLPKDWRVVCVGSGSPDHRKLLEKQVTESGLSENIIFTGQRKDSLNIIRASNAGILVSHHEGFSNSVLEYMAAGLPVIATNIGGNRDAVRNKSTGLLVSPGDPEALATALTDIANNPEMCQEFGQKGSDRVKKYFSIDTCIHNYNEFYYKIKNSRM